jgi:hypothetical protein
MPRLLRLENDFVFGFGQAVPFFDDGMLLSAVGLTFQRPDDEKALA